MRKLKALWRSAFDIREGERLRVLFMTLCFLFVLTAHYILKPISQGLFLGKYDVDKYPYLYILIAVVGSLFASLYTRVAVRSSLRAAAAWAMALAVAGLVGFWWISRLQLRWMAWPFNVYANLFGCIMVGQCWLVSANVFSSREAKRVYPLVGLGAITGAWVGSWLTVRYSGQTAGLVLSCAALVALAYVSMRLAMAQPGLSLAKARGAEEEEGGFSIREILVEVGRHPHLRIITWMVAFMFIVDVLVQYQLGAAAQAHFGKAEDRLNAFFGTYGLYQNLVTFFLQFVLTGAVVRYLGVKGALQLMPVSITLASVGSLLAPGHLSAAAVRLTEAASRYSFNRTGMELLYLPLPLELRNRTKAFMEITVDRASRGIAGVLLLALGWMGMRDPTKLPLVVIGFTACWMFLSWKAQKEYTQTLRKRLEARRLDLESARVAVGDPSLIGLLEQTARGGSARQACYALSVLAEAPGYDLARLLAELAESPLAPVRSKVYELARSIQSPALLGRAVREIGSGERTAAGEAVAYVLAVSPEAPGLAREYIADGDPLVVESALNALGGRPEVIRQAVTHEWLSRSAGSSERERRRLAALAAGLRGDGGTEFVDRLLEDPDPRVVSAACQAAGRLKNRAHVPQVVSRLADGRVRQAAVDALAAYGTRICGTLGDLLEDDAAPIAVRRHIPRVLRLVEDQRSADVLLRCISQRNLILRGAVLRALNRLRETVPTLDYGPAFVTKQILSEARHYYELHAALAPLRDQTDRRSAPGLLASSVEERLRQTLERLFRLLGLRYPPKEIYAAYLAVNRRERDQYAAALDFLENVLDRDLKRVLLPLLEDSGNLLERGRDLFGLDVKGPEQAVRELIRSGDPWLTACAMAAAADLKLRNLSADIREAAEGAGVEVCQVARAAQAALS